MTKSESVFRCALKENLIGCYIRKLPDYKQTAKGLTIGLPDYVVFYNGVSLWFEVKYVTSVSCFNFGIINPHQWITFKHMLDSGVDVMVGVYDRDYKLYLVKFSKILSSYLDRKKNMKFVEQDMNSFL